MNFIAVRLRCEQLRGRERRATETMFDETALRRVVGGSAVMWMQLHPLKEAANMSSGTLQGIPYVPRPHPAMDMFTILELIAVTVVYCTCSA